MFSEATKNQTNARVIIVLTTLLFFILGFFIALLVIRSEKKARQVLKNMNESVELRVEERTAEVKHEQKKVSLILETVKDAIVTCDAKGIIETFNPGAMEIFGYQAEEIIGQSVSILMTDEVAKHHDQ